jgi:hypothetical protein
MSMQTGGMAQSGLNYEAVKACEVAREKVNAKREQIRLAVE